MSKILREMVIKDIESQDRLDLLDLQIIGLMKIDTDWRAKLFEHAVILRLLNDMLFYQKWIWFWELIDRDSTVKETPK